MKLIFDFDDTILDTRRFKEYMYLCLKEVGVSANQAKKRYEELRAKDTPFSLKNFLESILGEQTLIENVYEKITEKCSNFLNEKLLEIARKAGKNNCYIVTNGDQEFQMDKIKKAGIFGMFRDIYVVPGSKKNIIEDICQNHKTESVIFIDDKAKFFNDLDKENCKNLKTVLFDENGLANFIKEVNTASKSR